jgi:hypothetical protein
VPVVPEPFTPVVAAVFAVLLVVLLDAVSDGMVSEMLTFDVPPVALERPPDAVALPMPPTDDELELVVAEDVADVPMLFRLDPPPCPMPTDDEPEVDPDDEFAVVSACATWPTQNRTAHAICNVVLFIVVLRK